MGTLYGRMLINEGELQAAQDEFNRLVKRYPDTPGLRLSHALVALENGQTDLARQELTQLAEQGHHVSEANYYLGRIEDQAGNTEQAIGYYQSVEQGNYYFPALARASQLLAENGQLEDAIDRIRRLRSTNPDQAENFWLLEVNLLLDQEQQQQALSTATEALEELSGQHRDPLRPGHALRQHRTACRRRSRPAQIIEQEPENAVALNALGYILTTRTDQPGEARGYIEKALRLDPEQPGHSRQHGLGTVPRRPQPSRTRLPVPRLGRLPGPGSCRSLW